MKICILGAPLDTGNMGVSALGTSLVHLILKQKPDAEISFFVGKRLPSGYLFPMKGEKKEVEVINYRMSPRARLNEHLFFLLAVACLQRVIPVSSIRRKIIDFNPRLGAIRESDFAGDIRGGDSFSDIYGVIDFIMGCIPGFIVLLLGKKLVLFPQTYGPYNSRISRFIAKIILRRAFLILSRDEEGVSFVRGLLGERKPHPPVVFCPDVAFSLEPGRGEDIPIHPSLPEDRKLPVIGFNISGLLYNGGFTRNNMFCLKFNYREFARNLSEKLMRETDAHLLLVPHTFCADGNVESDPQACEEIFRFLSPRYKERIHIVTRECDPSEVKGIIGSCDFFIGSRMHACIAALSQGIPTVGVAYSRKFRGVFDSIGVGHMALDARSVDENEAIGTILNTFKESCRMNEFLRERVSSARDRLTETFRKILDNEIRTDDQDSGKTSVI